MEAIYVIIGATVVAMLFLLARGQGWTWARSGASGSNRLEAVRARAARARARACELAELNTATYDLADAAREAFYERQEILRNESEARRWEQQERAASHQSTPAAPAPIYSGTVVNANSADQAGLQSAGFSSAQAQAIITRRQQGAFGSLNDLLAIPGITNSVLDPIRHRLTA